MNKIKFIYSLLLAFILSVSIAMPAASLAAKDRAPDFEMKTLRGGNINLSDYNGKYVLLNFWATWCGPCKIEMPSMEALFSKFKSKNFEILAVSNDIFGAKVVKPFVDAHNMSFTVSLDQDLKVSSRYGVMSLPTTFLIDPKGTIIGVINGAQEWDHPETLQYFENLLNKN
ncbi:MAG: TlpA disulfide reductase family protein [Nitrospinales bacterium]